MKARPRETEGGVIVPEGMLLYVIIPITLFIFNSICLAIGWSWSV